MPTDPYTPAELDAGARALHDTRHVIASDGYPSIVIGTDEQDTKTVLDAAAPLIAARATKPYRDRIEALEQLLACYRIGKPPSESLHRRLDKTRAVLATTEGETDA